MNFKIKKTHKIKIQKRGITLILITLMVIILFFCGYSFGKQINISNINGKGEIAKPILVVENSQPTKMESMYNNGIYEFSIKNYNNSGEINQVDLIYNIEILSKYDEFIIITLYKENERFELYNKKTENVKLAKNEQKEDKYRLEVRYDRTILNKLPAIIQDIQIKVHTEQVAT